MNLYKLKVPKKIKRVIIPAGVNYHITFTKEEAILFREYMDSEDSEYWTSRGLDIITIREFLPENE